MLQQVVDQLLVGQARVMVAVELVELLQDSAEKPVDLRLLVVEPVVVDPSWQLR